MFHAFFSDLQEKWEVVEDWAYNLRLYAEVVSWDDEFDVVNGRNTIPPNVDGDCNIHEMKGFFEAIWEWFWKRIYQGILTK